MVHRSRSTLHDSDFAPFSQCVVTFYKTHAIKRSLCFPVGVDCFLNSITPRKKESDDEMRDSSVPNLLTRAKCVTAHSGRKQLIYHVSDVYISLKNLAFLFNHATSRSVVLGMLLSIISARDGRRAIEWRGCL